MDSRFKTSNIVALLIAVALIASGFALMFIHQQMESAEEQKRAKKPITTGMYPATGSSFSQLAQIHTEAVLPVHIPYSKTTVDVASNKPAS